MTYILMYFRRSKIKLQLAGDEKSKQKQVGGHAIFSVDHFLVNACRNPSWYVFATPWLTGLQVSTFCFVHENMVYKGIA